MNIQIIHRYTKAVLFKGDYDSIKQALEAAVKAGVDLTGAPLYDVNFSDADLTGAKLTGATIIDADLSGAKLYDVDLDDAKFKPGWKIVKDKVQS